MVMGSAIVSFCNSLRPILGTLVDYVGNQSHLDADNNLARITQEQ